LALPPIFLLKRTNYLLEIISLAESSSVLQQTKMRWSRLSFRIAKKLFLAYSRYLTSLNSDHRDTSDIPSIVVNGTAEKRKARRSSLLAATPGTLEYHSDSEVIENRGNQSPRTANPDLNNSPPETDEANLNNINYDSFKRTSIG